MLALKPIIGILGVILTLIGYIPYVRDVLKGKTTPHIYSWFLWGFVTSIAFALQLSDNGGPGVFVTLAAAIMCILVLVFGIVRKGPKDITVIDTVFIALAFISLALWLFAKQPVISAILITLTDILGFAPTIRKTWNKPHSETLSFYLLNTIRFVLAVIALERYTIITALYPIIWLFANGLFAVMLVVRRKMVRS